MKKWILGIVLAVVMAVCLVSCGGTESNARTQSMFVTVEYGINYDIVYCRETKVMYAISDGSYNRGTFTLLVNADGSPMIWESEE